MKDSLRLVHFHIGSQVNKIRRIKLALREASQFFVQIYKMGFKLDFVDVGGGLVWITTEPKAPIVAAA